MTKTKLTRPHPDLIIIKLFTLRSHGESNIPYFRTTRVGRETVYEGLGRPPRLYLRGPVHLLGLGYPGDESPEGYG